MRTPLPDPGLQPEPDQWINWYDAWLDSSVGVDGFWRKERPAAHFRTATGATGLLARMVLSLLAARPSISTVVDIGSGDGRLLTNICALAPRLRLVGLDLRPAPTAFGSMPTLEWRRGYWDTRVAAWRAENADPVPLEAVLPVDDGQKLIVCAEWLDELPTVIAEQTREGWRQVAVSSDGRESLGGPVSDPDARWLEHWWPAAPGMRAESGYPRDTAWSAVLDSLRPSGGLAVMIDYGHRRTARPAAGTLTGYLRGRQVRPRPSATINLTAHVAVDSLLASGESAGARTEFLLSQREAVARLLPSPGRTDGSGTLARLQASSERRLLADTLGDHWWLVQSVDAPIPRRRTSCSWCGAEQPVRE